MLLDCDPRFDWAPENVVLASGVQCQPHGIGRGVILDMSQQQQLHEMYLSRSLGSTSADAKLGQLKHLWGQYVTHLLSMTPAQRQAMGIGISVSRSGRWSWANVQSRIAGIVNFSAFVKQLPGATSEERLIADRMVFSVQSFKSAMIGSLKLEIGSWFLARPNFMDEGDREAAAMWFGNVTNIFNHFGPNQEFNLILEVITKGYL